VPNSDGFRESGQVRQHSGAPLNPQLSTLSPQLSILNSQLSRSVPAWPVGSILGLLVLAVPAGAAGSAARVRLRHQIAPGSVAVYKVQVTVARRPIDQADRDEQTQVQTGTLTRVIFRENEPDWPTCAQMLEFEAGAAAGGEVSQGSSWVQISSARIRADRAAFIVPAGTGWSRAARSAVVQVTDWPGEKVSTGDTWEQPFQAHSIKGRQYYQVRAIDTTGTDSRVTLTVTTEPEPPPASTTRRLVSAESTLVWSVRDGELLSLDGRLVYREAIRAGGRQVQTRITFSRVQRRRMLESQQAIERQAIMRLTQAVAAYQREDLEGASRTLQSFVNRWPRSLWRPAADYLSRRLQAERTGRQPLPTAELKEALVGLLALWAQAEPEEDFETLNHCRLSLAHLTQVNRPEITRLLDDPEGGFRALGCFALAFGSAPADVALIQKKCADADVRVRRMAACALAIRASPLTDAEILLTCLGDDDARVRQRACQAIGRCVGRDSDHLSAARSALVARLSDPSPAVMLAAARALMRTGAAAEIEKVRQAAEDAGPGTLRDALREILTLKRQEDDPSP